MPVIFSIRGENRAVFEDGECFRRGIRADRPVTDAEIEQMKPNMTHHFRCVDDDGMTYFWGVCNEKSFAPLDMVGYSYGCTEIHYKDEKTGRFERL